MTLNDGDQLAHGFDQLRRQAVYGRRSDVDLIVAGVPPFLLRLMNNARIKLFVALVVALAVGVAAVSWASHSPYPGHWELVSFVFVALLLEQSSNRLSVGAAGSLAFVMYLSAGILFGGFWGGVVACLSSGTHLASKKVAPLKIVFNGAQFFLAVAAPMLLYSVLGGNLPPAYLASIHSQSLDVVRSDLLLFFVFAAGFFAINSAAVSKAVSLSTQRPFREIWNLNTRGVLGYDLGASFLAVLAAVLFTFAQRNLGFGALGLAIAVVPVVVVRHVYGMYYQLQDSGRELLEVMVKAIEARDPYTSGHSLRVSELSRTIALELGLSSKEVEQVRTAALLHDVGKIHEEFAPLLRKEARLTPEEMALMQTHSTKSAELVGIISKFRGFVQDSVRHHHERWDGQGYPAGIAGSEIPLGSRIILVSDTIDAMTTDRPYRKRLPLDVVVTELQKCKGTQFDPSIVDVVVSSVAVRRLISGAHPDGADAGAPRRSKRVSWPSAGIWRARG